MTKVLLARPGPEQNAIRRRSMADVGIGFLVTALRRQGHDVDFVDLNLPGLTTKEFAGLCRARRYDLIGIKMLSIDSLAVEEMIAEAQAANSNTITIVGGPHPSGMGARIFRQYPTLDFAMIGEGENGLPMLAELARRGRERALAANTDLARIRGLIYRSADGVRANDPLWVEDLDSLGFPDFDAMNIAYYVSHPRSFMGYHLPVLTGRGCPFDCQFCAALLTNGRRRRTHSIDYVMEYIHILRHRYGARSFNLIDDNFLSNAKFAEQFCQRLLNDRPGMTWHCVTLGIRADLMTEDLVVLMEKSGCLAIGVGIESGSQRVLELMHKRETADLVYDRIRMVRAKTKMHVFGFHVIGFPGEEEAERRTSLRRALKSGLNYASFSMFQPFPGTPAGETVITSTDSKWFARLFYENSSFRSAAEARRLRRFQRRAFARFYLRPRILWSFLVGLLRGRYSISILAKTTLYVFLPQRLLRTEH